MSYLLNYKNWRSLYESANADTLVPVKPGNQLINTDGYKTLDFDKSTNATAWGILKDTVGMESLPGATVYFGGNPSMPIKSQQLRIFTAILDGISKATGSELNADDLTKAEEFAKKANISLEKGEKVQLYGPGKIDGRGWMVDTVGKVGESGFKEAKTSTSPLGNIVSYINNFNLQNWASGDFTQYDPTKIVNDSKLTDLSASSPAIVKERGYLMLVGTGETSIKGGTIGKEQEITQGEEGKTGAVDIAFTVGSADTDSAGVKVDANHPKVKEIGEKIINYIGERGVIDKMILTSSASPEYGTIKNVPGWEKSYPKGTGGTQDPGSGTDDASKNMKLAYDRGITFKNALVAYLGGHLKANSISVAWKISTDAPGNGRNISYTMETPSVAPQAIERTTFQGAKVKTEGSAMTLYVYKVNYQGSALAKTKEGGFLKKGMVPYEQLKPGMKINILAQDMKTKGEAEVSKVEGNNVFFNKGEKKDQLLPKERYLGQVGKAKGEEAEF